MSSVVSRSRPQPRAKPVLLARSAPLPAIDKKTQQGLRGKAHHLKPILWVGAQGWTPQVAQELDKALNHHKLMKIKLLVEDAQEKKSLVEQILQHPHCHLIHSIGHTLVLYRPQPIELEKKS